MGGSGGTGGTGGQPTTVTFECTGADTDGGDASGLVHCSNGWVHRTSATECPSSIDEWNPVFNGRDGGADALQCTKNEDCTEKPNGYCVTSVGFGGGGMPGANISHCAYGCTKDSDCPTGEACLCGDPVGSCVAASCRTDSDCPDSACVELGQLGATGCGYNPAISLACWKPDMDCATAADCTGPSVACNGGHCRNVPVCGRPFLVEGALRRAEATGSSEWSAYLEPEGLGALDAATRAGLAAHWTEMALMEHASIAAFARFALDLLALGAPPALLEATHSALRDETHHARLCFGMASSYAGRDVGPGRLPVHGVLPSQSAAAIVETAFLEACVGETCAAIEAAEAAERATDPVVRAVLRRIAADETRHAELGFQFVRWGLASLGSEAHEAVERALSGLRVPAPADKGLGALAVEGTLAAQHGLLPPAVAAAVRDAAMREVVLPCARALLGVSVDAAA